MKNTAYILLFLFFSSVANADETIVIDNTMYGIDHSKKLIVSNASVTEINSNFPGIKSAISLNVNYNFVTPVESIETGIPYDVVSTAGDETDIYILYFTELPLAHINTPHEIVDEPRVYADFMLVESNGNTVSSAIGIEYKGGWTQSLAKKSLRIEFWEDETGDETLDFSLLEMRSDDDWNMEAMFNEPLRLRSKTNFDLWKLFHTMYYIDEEPDAVNGVTMEYSEIFINGEYRGVYAISERVDRKQLKLKKHNGSIRGELYKGDQWGNGAVTFTWVGPYDNNSDMWDGFEYEHPEEEIDWSNLYNLVDFVKNGSDTDFYTQYQEKFHLDNIVDYFIFLNVLRATDNTGKNLFLAKYNTEEPYYYVPWDLDGTFGTIWDGSMQNITTGLLTNGLYDRLWLDCDENGFRTRLKDRWNSVKQTIFNHDFLMGMFEENHSYLQQNGVYEREEIAWHTDLWPNYSTSTDYLNYMSTWITNRLAHLDARFNEDCTMSVSDITFDKIRVYPNPASDYLYFNHTENEPFTVSVYDIQGKKLLEEKIENDRHSISVSSLISGIYIVKIETNTASQTEKIIISK